MLPAPGAAAAAEWAVWADQHSSGNSRRESSTCRGGSCSGGSCSGGSCSGGSCSGGSCSGGSCSGSGSGSGSGHGHSSSGSGSSRSSSSRGGVVLSLCLCLLVHATALHTHAAASKERSTTQQATQAGAADAAAADASAASSSSLPPSTALSDKQQQLGAAAPWHITAGHRAAQQRHTKQRSAGDRQRSAGDYVVVPSHGEEAARVRRLLLLQQAAAAEAETGTLGGPPTAQPLKDMVLEGYAGGAAGVATPHVLQAAAAEQLAGGGEAPSHPAHTPTTPLPAAAPRPAAPAEWPALDLDVAMALGRLEIVTYCSDIEAVAQWTCSRCRDVGDFQPAATVFDANKDVFGMAGWYPPLGAKVVAFRGTNSHDIWNWVDDMRAWRIDFQVPIPGAQGAKIHAGFWDLFVSSALAANLTEAYGRLLEEHPSGPTYVLGHSMGAALAQLCALWLKSEFRGNPGAADIRLVTWGAPRVGNSVYAQLLANTSSGHWRFTHGRDVVPSVPPQLLGYQHAPQEMWLLEVVDPSSKQVVPYVVVCSKTGEDPLCHNSVCYLGICTSVADHLDYMGLNFYQDSMEC